MANVLPFKVRSKIVRTLVEGTGLRPTARLTDSDKDVVMRLQVTVGQGCERLHDKLVRNVKTGPLELDETWSFVGKHERRNKKDDPKSWGDIYTLFALDADTKFVPSYYTGKRTPETANAFMRDLHSRVEGEPQVSVDGWPPWIEALRRSFGHRGVHAASIVKEYQKECAADLTARQCGRVKSADRTVIYGEPDADFISTSKAERLNLTTRMHQRRFTRLTNAYSRKAENHAAAAALHYFWYNFVRRHDAIGTTPAVKAGVTDHQWTIDEMTRAALEEMGAMNPPLKGTRHRRERKTHAADADPLAAARPERPTQRGRRAPPAEPGPMVARSDVYCPHCGTELPANLVRRAARKRAQKVEPPEDNQEDALDVPDAPVTSPDRKRERGLAPIVIVAHVAIFAVGVGVGANLGRIEARPFGPVPVSGVALGAAVAGGALAYGLGRRDVARGAAALAAGLGTGMLGRRATRGLLARSTAPSDEESAPPLPLWKRGLRWIFG